MVKVMKKVSENYVRNAEAVREFFPDAVVLDVTVEGGMRKLDPGSIWGEKKEMGDGKYKWIEGVEVPGREKEKGLSLKGVMEGLKVFKRKGSDEKWWKDEKLVGKERNCKSYGKLMGFDLGKECVKVEIGMKIFERIYRKEVEKRFGKIIERLSNEERVVVLLDYKDGDERKMIDHAEILKRMIEGKKGNEVMEFEGINNIEAA